MLVSFAIFVILVCGAIGHAAGWPVTGLWAGVAAVGLLVYFLGDDA